MRNKYRVEGDVVYIELIYKGQTYETLVDTIDLPKLLAVDCKWSVNISTSGKMRVACYPTKPNKFTKTTMLHRFIMEPKDGMDVDHEDGNQLNNRRYNLRILTRAQNNQNQHGIRKHSSNNYRGVRKRGQKYQARIRHNGKEHFVGSFNTEDEATEAVKKARREILPFSVE